MRDMSDTVVKVDGLTKKYAIRHQRNNHEQEFYEIISRPFWFLKNKLAHPFRYSDTGFYRGEYWEEFYALRNVSFEIKRGERVGIIGRNGAGKSTLLKILSRITTPSSGRAEIIGRLASLLEVGTGFHPELTGRENIFLNGAILGMPKVEIKRKFDEIVDFSGVEKFLDTPVKRYSSGMYVRLAFAVAAHLEPETLIVDEVLAVGDSVFQKKCIDKMLEVSGQGRTILFVSHNFSAIKALCSKAMLLDKGRLVYSGDVEETIGLYAGESRLSGKEIDLTQVERQGEQELIFENIKFQNYPVHFGESIRFMVKLKSTGENKVFRDLDFGFAIRDKNLNCLVHCSNRYLNKSFNHSSDDNVYLFEIDNILKPDVYSLVFFLRCNEIIQDWIQNAVKLEIEDGNPYGFHDSKQIQGSILPRFDISLL